NMMVEMNVDPYLLLENLEKILSSDPHIDEVGFIHPAQFAAFGQDRCASSSSEDACQVFDEITDAKPVVENSFSNFFWHREHKLGISTLILFPLYNAARDAFLNAYIRYRDSMDDASVETMDEVMKHSRGLILLSSDHGTAWNSRKMIISKNPLLPVLMDELRLSALVLSHSPKSERTWSHRRWAIKIIAGSHLGSVEEIASKESEFVKSIVERFKMNYRAWSHRCWIVSYMAYPQLLHEIEDSHGWSALHVADNSCYHYRALLLLKMAEEIRRRGGQCSEFHRLWKEELHWTAALIDRFVGREALWLHRRFLALTWAKHLKDDRDFGSDHRDYDGDGVGKFVKDEIVLVQSCSVVPDDDDFDDHKAQAVHSGTYISWLAKQMPDLFLNELRKSSENYDRIKVIMNDIGRDFLLD
ncbi:hypothetical protein M569_03814, partial [Genlisea aurea]